MQPHRDECRPKPHRIGIQWIRFGSRVGSLHQRTDQTIKRPQALYAEQGVDVGQAALPPGPVRPVALDQRGAVGDCQGKGTVVVKAGFEARLE